MSLDLKKPLRTRDGRPVQLIYCEGRGSYPLIGYVERDTYPTFWTREGRGSAVAMGGDSPVDLFNTPEKIKFCIWTHTKYGHQVTIGEYKARPPYEQTDVERWQFLKQIEVEIP